MSMDIVPVTTPDDCFAIAERVTRSTLVPQAYRGKPVDAAIAMMYGSEMGLRPMTALQRIVVINGKPTLDAQGMVALIRLAGHSISGEVTSEAAHITGKRCDTGDEMTVTFTMDDAKRADLLKNATYKKFPSDMLWARAVTQLGRRLFADVLMGASYAPEEMQAVVEDEDKPSYPRPLPAEPDVVTVRPPPNRVIVADENGEVIDAELVPDADVLMHELGAVIVDKADPLLVDALRGFYGPSAEMNPEDIPKAIEFAKNWVTVAAEPVQEEF